MARRYEFYVLVARTISHSFAALTHEILLLPLEHKIHIFSPPCNILYISLVVPILYCRRIHTTAMATHELKPLTYSYSTCIYLCIVRTGLRKQLEYLYTKLFFPCLFLDVQIARQSIKAYKNPQNPFSPFHLH